jgi:hypothetical protein
MVHGSGINAFLNDPVSLISPRESQQRLVKNPMKYFCRTLYSPKSANIYDLTL